jgi:uncharacterized protein YacL (UPF0231 family)
MISFIHYISAKRRLKEAEKSVYMLGGEREAPPMILAQRDMIKHEVEYYEDESVTLLFIITFVSVIAGTIYFILWAKGIV